MATVDQILSTNLIPTTVEGFDLAWFDSVLDEDVLAARRLEVMGGTASKIHVELTFGRKDGSRETKTVWVKTGLEKPSKDPFMSQLYAGETFFYRTMGGRFDTRTPHCYYAETDQSGNSVVVLADLGDLNVKFVEPATAATPDEAARGLDAIARWQAASWMNEELLNIPYLRNGGNFRTGDFMELIYGRQLWAECTQLPRFQVLAPQFRDRDLLITAHRKLQDSWWTRAPLVISHSDCHYGQAYILPDGEARILDWQCVQLAHWANDMSNFLVSALSVEDRRKYERDLVRHHVTRLKEFGVENAPTPEAAFEEYRAYALHGIGWVTCSHGMQPEEITFAMTERFSAAAEDLGSIELVIAGPKN